MQVYSDQACSFLSFTYNDCSFLVLKRFSLSVQENQSDQLAGLMFEAAPKCHRGKVKGILLFTLMNTVHNNSAYKWIFRCIEG